jgi:hypothetical protein
MSALGQTRPSRAIGDMSPIPPITAVMLQRHERQKHANNGLGRVARVDTGPHYSITSSARATSSGGRRRAGTGRARRSGLRPPPRPAPELRGPVRFLRARAGGARYALDAHYHFWFLLDLQLSRDGSAMKMRSNLLAVAILSAALVISQRRRTSRQDAPSSPPSELGVRS